MTAPTLPETLARLARLLPERVLDAGDDHVLVWDEDGDLCSLEYGRISDMQILSRILHAELLARFDAPESAAALALGLLGALGGEGA